MSAHVNKKGGKHRTFLTRCIAMIGHVVYHVRDGGATKKGCGATGTGEGKDKTAQKSDGGRKRIAQAHVDGTATRVKLPKEHECHARKEKDAGGERKY